VIAFVIEWCARHRWLVLLAYAALTAFAVRCVRETPIDAIPALEDPQVIVFTEYRGQSPTIVEDQVTYPIASRLLATPKVTAVRGYSMLGMSFVHVVFESGTDTYWARSRVLEVLSTLGGRMPAGVTPTLGPDASGVGWVYEYALVDRGGQHDLGELRALQDFTLRYALESVPGVAQVASVGGYEREYQVTLDPQKLRAYGLGVADVADAARRATGEQSGRVLEMSGREYFVRGRGYLEKLGDLEQAVVRVSGSGGAPLRIADVGTVRFGPGIRRGIAELDGRGETVGAIVIARSGENPGDVIARVKARLDDLRPGLPPGVEIVTTYDRTPFIDRAIETLQKALLEEGVTVAAVILVFLLHFRSALLPAVTMPLAVLLAFIPMWLAGVTSNIMSLGGIAIAIGATVDAEIVMIEACHKKLEHAPPDMPRAAREKLLHEAAREVTPAIFFSLLIIAASFLPVFGLTGQAGRLFVPLALTKTFVMLSAALLSVTLAPALRDLLLRGKVWSEDKHPVSRIIRWAYEPFVHVALARPRTTLAIGAFAVLSAVPVFLRLGSEFMPPLHEGDMLYMPTTLPNLSIEEAKRQLALQDRILASMPEVSRVFGKIGRAETPTDPAPLSMVETVVQLKPPSAWPTVRRARWYSAWAPAPVAHALGKVWPEETPETWEELVAKLDGALRQPGWTNAWTMPVRARIDMLTTGVRTPVGIKVLGPDLAAIERAGTQLEAIARAVPGTRSALYERTLGGSYIDVIPDRAALARSGLSVSDVNALLTQAIGGDPVTTTVDGRKRFAVSVRYAEDFRARPDALRDALVPLPAAREANANASTSQLGPAVPRLVRLGDIAEVRITEGPPMVRSEAGMLVGYVYVDIEPWRDLGSWVEEAKKNVDAARARGDLVLGGGAYVRWTGQYELLEQMHARMKLLVPLALLVVALLLYAQFRNVTEVAIVLLSIPFALVGSVWMLYLLDYRLSTAVWVGVIALVGLATQTGVVMIVYIDHAFERRVREGRVTSLADIIEAHAEGTIQRVRPKLMTVATMLIGLVPLLWATGSGADVMKRIAAPMVGGLVSSAFLTLELIPVVYTLWRHGQLRRAQRAGRSLAEVCGLPGPPTVSLPASEPEPS
jgi:Cu(I)/Ag(I) efflux system membrane protein CusA/SilA